MLWITSPHICMYITLINIVLYTSTTRIYVFWTQTTCGDPLNHIYFFVYLFKQNTIRHGHSNTTAWYTTLPSRGPSGPVPQNRSGRIIPIHFWMCLNSIPTQYPHLFYRSLVFFCTTSERAVRLTYNPTSHVPSQVLNHSQTTETHREKRKEKKINSKPQPRAGPYVNNPRNP